MGRQGVWEIRYSHEELHNQLDTTRHHTDRDSEDDEEKRRKNCLDFTAKNGSVRIEMC